MRAAKIIGLKAHIVRNPSRRRLARVPTPAILRLKTGDYILFTGKTPTGLFRTIDPITRIPRECTIAELAAEIEPLVILVARHFLGTGVDPRSFGFRWFAPSLWRYRKPLVHVLIASLFVQIFALVSPLFFQVVIDKVLTTPDDTGPLLRPLHLVVRETEFCGLRLAGDFRCRTRENGGNSVRRPRCASLTRRNYGGFCLPGNRPGLSGLHGGGCRN